MNVFYTATKNDKSHSGFIDAENNKLAHEKLTMQGYEDICFHNDVIGSWIDKEIEDDELTAKIHSEINSQSGYGFFIKTLMWSTRWALLFVLLALLLAAYYQSWYAASALCLVVFIMFGVAIYRFGYSIAFNKLLEAYVFGCWDEFPKLLEKGKKLKHFPDVVVELAFYEAKYWVEKGDFEKAQSLITVHENSIKEVQPGIFESKMASLYFQAGKVKEFLELMRLSKEQSGGLPLLVLDWALVEAKYGNPDEVIDYMEMLNQERFSELALIARDFLSALLLYRKNNPACLTVFGDAALAFGKFKGSPLSLLFINEIKTYHAFALYHFGEKQMAKKLAHTVWDLAKIHGSVNEKQMIKSILENG